MPLRQLFPDPENTSSESAEVDVIAVHGLNPRSKKDADHAWDTWRKPPGPKGRLWLRDDLPRYIPHLRIFLYEYNATAVYGEDRDTFVGKANELLEAIRIKRDGIKSRPILMLGHSMGGLLIKQALINAHNNPHYTPIKDATTGLAFFATPHNGGDWKRVSLGKLTAKIAIAAGFQKGDNVVEVLDKGTIFSDVLQEHWRHQLLQYNIVSFWGALDDVVPMDSARLGLPGNRENVVKLNADHRQVCKFGDSQTDQDNFELVRSNIRDMYKNALEIPLKQNLDDSVRRLEQPRQALDYTPLNEGGRKCLTDLRVTDPRMDKMRIEQTKGGLLEDSYGWILDHRDFRTWRDNEHSRLLWIKGDPGKGKTMLLCGIIDKLQELSPGANLSFFFCQADDSRINNATAVLRGLVFLLVEQQPSLLSYIQGKHATAGKTLFEDSNAWFALSDIFTNMLRDQHLRHTYIIIDALDECVAADLPKLLDLIAQKSSAFPRVKWIVSSRNWRKIERELDTAAGAQLCLELNQESISAAVKTFIESKVAWLAKRNKYEDDTRDAVMSYLSSNANDTFLWAALVCQHIADDPDWKVQEKLTVAGLPPGLDGLYGRMMDHICISDDAKLCKSVLAVVSVVYRPITLDELASLANLPDPVAKEKALKELIGLCGSFLTLRNRTIYFVHQSAKEFLSASWTIFPFGPANVHYRIFLRSLESIKPKLKRDIYGIHDPGLLVDEINTPDKDPLFAVRYSCVYWVNHLRQANRSDVPMFSILLELLLHLLGRLCLLVGIPDSGLFKGLYWRSCDLHDGGRVHRFLQEFLLNWLEALSLLRSVPDGGLAIRKLESLLTVSNTPIHAL